jgi:hypothetical protein
MYVSSFFAYMLSATWVAWAIAQEISDLVLAAQENFARRDRYLWNVLESLNVSNVEMYRC